MNKLLELTQDFAVSRPIFRLTKEEDGDTIRANSSEPVYKYEPKPEEGNILSELVCKHYEESFNIGRGTFAVDKKGVAQQAMNEIRSSFCKFLEKNLEMRNPRQSKVYRWYYRNLPSAPDFNDGLIMMYKYIRSFCDTEMRSSNVDHINNAIALLEAIMEKYEER